MTQISGKTACIVGAGEFTDRGIYDPFDLIIAADGGLSALSNIGIQPDMIIGDFDSLGYTPEYTKVCKHADPRAGRRLPADVSRPEVFILPVEKDDTDMAAACSAAWERGCRSFRIYGGSGDRPDHFLANLQLAAAYSRQGGDVRLVTPAYTVYVVTDGTLRLESVPGVLLSVFCHSDRAEGVTIEGDVKYILKEAELKNTRALGVSNLMTGKNARITVRRGTLLVFLYEDISNE